MKIIALSTIALALSVVAAPAGPSRTLPGPIAHPPVMGTCNIDEVAVFTDRVHIHCGVNYAGGFFLKYLAVESNSVIAGPVVTIATRALGQKKLPQLTVLFDDDTNNNPSGCLPGDCFRLMGVAAAP